VIFSTKGMIPRWMSLICNLIGAVLFLLALKRTISVIDLSTVLLWCVAAVAAYISVVVDRYSRSYISLYSDRIEGVAIGVSSNGPDSSIGPSSKKSVRIDYMDIESLSVTSDLNKVMVTDKYGEFVFQAYGCAKKVIDLINNQRR